MKQPIANIEEEVGKMVGKLSDSTMQYDRLAAAAECLMPRLPFPKGVYRFRSFAEADAWMEQHILRAARKKSQDRPA